MRKHTKVLVGMIAVISLVIGMAIPTFAADEGTLTVGDAPAIEEDGVFTVQAENGTITWANLNDSGIQDKDGSKQVGLKPQSGVDASEAYVEFTFTVETEGDYELTLGYAGDSTNRKANVSVDGNDPTTITASGNGWTVKVDSLTVKLSAGEHKVRFTNTPDFDGSTVKAINVVSVAWKFKAPAETDAPTTDAPTTDAPTTDAPTTNAPTTGKAPTTAPKTGFITVALAIAAVGSGAYVISKKH